MSGGGGEVPCRPVLSSGTGADCTPSRLKVHNSPLLMFASSPRRRREICARWRSVAKIVGAADDFEFVGGRMNIRYGI